MEHQVNLRKSESPDDHIGISLSSALSRCLAYESVGDIVLLALYILDQDDVHSGIDWVLNYGSHW